MEFRAEAWDDIMPIDASTRWTDFREASSVGKRANVWFATKMGGE